jgi:CRISPR/Cas system-associated exonuclease Cas4 (RecB family)
MQNFARLTIEDLHDKVCEQGQDVYIDPVSGYQVLTEQALFNHSKCCRSICRHCPYGHINLKG